MDLILVRHAGEVGGTDRRDVKSNDPNLWMTLGVQAHGDRHVGMAVERGVCPYQRLQVASLLRKRFRVARVSPMILPAPRGDPQEPLRRRCPVITGARCSVATVAINA